MNLDPALGRSDRIVNVVGGTGIVAYALLGDFDHAWIRAAMVIVGVLFVVGGLGGT